jgi:tetratricopeptide (TPR) repeat protein
LKGNVLQVRDSLAGVGISGWNGRCRLSGKLSIFGEPEYMIGLEANNPLKIHAAAEVAIKAGHFREAEGLYRKAISVAESSAGGAQPHVAKIADRLVELYRNQGRYEEAQQLCARVVGQIDPSQAAVANDQTLSRLAEFCRRAGDHHKATEFYREAINYRRQVFGHAHGKVAACIASLAETYRDLGNMAKARSLLLRAISMVEEAEDDIASALKPRLRELRESVLATA